MTLREPWRTRLLLLSFAINLLLVPIVAWHALREWAAPPPLPGGPPRPAVMMERVARELSGDDRTHFKAAVEPRLEEIEVARVQMEGARRAMLRAIAVDPFDPESVQTAMRRWQRTWHHWSDALNDTLLAGLGGVSPSGRERLADAGLHRRPR